MVLTTIDGKVHIRTDDTRRKVAVYDPAAGENGTILFKRGAEVCEIDLALLRKAIPRVDKQP